MTALPLNSVLPKSVSKNFEGHSNSVLFVQRSCGALNYGIAHWSSQTSNESIAFHIVVHFCWQLHSSHYVMSHLISLNSLLKGLYK